MVAVNLASPKSVKRKVEIKIRAFLAFCGQTTMLLFTVMQIAGLIAFN